MYFMKRVDDCRFVYSVKNYFLCVMLFILRYESMNMLKFVFVEFCCLGNMMKVVRSCCKVICLFFVVVVLFVFCVFFYYICLLLKWWEIKLVLDVGIFLFIFFLIFYLNSVFNFVLYVFFLVNFRKSFKEFSFLRFLCWKYWFMFF